MEPEADKLIIENMSKNLADQVCHTSVYSIQEVLAILDIACTLPSYDVA